MTPTFVKKSVALLGGLISKGHPRSVKAKKNILASFLIKGASIAISLILVPLTINYVNPTQYGIWLTLSSIIGWFSFFDIGFGNGLRNRFAEAIAKEDYQTAKIYVSTTYAILTIIITGVLLLFLVINPFLDWSKILNTPAGMASELSVLVLIVFVFFCIQFILQLITTIIIADQQPAKASLLTLLGSVLSLITIFILTKTTSGNLIYLGTALSVSPAIVLVVSSLILFKRKYKKYAPSFKHIRFSYARSLMSLGIKFFMLQIAAVILFQTSNIIISQLFGPAEVTPYNIAYKYFNVAPMIFAIIMTPFWSAFTESWVRGDIAWIKSTIKKLQLLWVVFSIGAVLMLLLSDTAYKLWVGDKIHVPLSVSVVMFINVIIYNWCSIYSHFLNGLGKIKLQLFTGIAGSLLNIPLAIFLGKTFGIFGIALSTTLISLATIILSPLQYHKIITNKATGIWGK